MNRIKLFAALALLTSLMLTASITVRPANAATVYSCLPTCATNDGRFLTMAGADLSTNAGLDIALEFTSLGASPLEFGIFDGDTGGLWDSGTEGLVYTLYADPSHTGTPVGSALGQWNGNDSFPANAFASITHPAGPMVDNGWWPATIANVPAALSSDGSYRYLLTVHLPDSTVPGLLSNFKVRSSGFVELLARTQSNPQGSPFSYIASLEPDATNSAPGAVSSIIFPAFPTLTPTTYDGSWNFYMNAPTPPSSFAVFDGDFDHSQYDCSDLAIDNHVIYSTFPTGVPPWAPGAFPEGYPVHNAVPCLDANGNVITGPNGVTTGTGNPPDDFPPNLGIPGFPFGAMYVRPPAVYYQIVLPNNGGTVVDAKPSGNVEWQEFRLDTAPFNAATMNVHKDSLPAGIYKVQIVGLDMENLNSFVMPYNVCGVDANGKPQCPPLPGPKCPTTDLKGSIYVGSTTATGTVTNASSIYNYLVGMASYAVRDNTYADQILWDSQSASIGPKGKVTLTVNLVMYNYKHYATQVDLFCGPVLQSLATQLYGDRKLDYFNSTYWPYYPYSVKK